MVITYLTISLNIQWDSNIEIMYWATIHPELLNPRRNPFVRKVQPLLALTDQLRLLRRSGQMQISTLSASYKAGEGSFTQKIEKLISEPF